MFKKKSILAVIVLFSMIFVLTACGTKNDSAEKPAGKNVSAQIMFNGSSTLSPVISKIATDFTEKNEKWNKVDSSLPDSNITIYVSSGGSGAGIKAIIDGTADFGLVSRNVKEEEKAKVKDYKEYKVGIDALTIAVNQKNPIKNVKDNLTSEEIKKIFSGEYKTWNQVDPSLPNKEIVVVTRDVGGGAHEVFQKNIMGEEKIVKTAIQAPSMGALVAKVIENEYAIGYASYGVSKQNEGKLFPLKVDGVAATPETILDGTYKIQRPLLIVGHGELTALQKSFMDYVRSEAGLKVVEAMGFISVK
ncbi:MAG: phosphate ABC transporter substrate-binding protein [Clostridiaceae bacterium]